jgi:hypothetical protein
VKKILAGVIQIPHGQRRASAMFPDAPTRVQIGRLSEPAVISWKSCIFRPDQSVSRWFDFASTSV